MEFAVIPGGIPIMKLAVFWQAGSLTRSTKPRREWDLTASKNTLASLSVTFTVPLPKATHSRV